MTTMSVVGECFFWYRLTRVFPDNFHRAVKRLCVCVCVCSLQKDCFSIFFIDSEVVVFDVIGRYHACVSMA